MDLSKKNTVGSPTRKTKIMLQEELSIAQDKLSRARQELQESREEITKLQSALEDTQAEATKLKERQKQSELAEAELEQAIKLMEENEQLKTRLQNAEEMLSAQIEEVTENLHKAEQQQKDLAKENLELKRKIADYDATDSLEDRQEKVPDITAARSSFQINLYPRQGKFHGQIIHSLTQDKRTFSSLEDGTIVAFISSHLPQISENGDTPRQPLASPELTAAPGAKDIAEKEQEEVTDEAVIPRVIKIETVQADTGTPSSVMHHNQTYQVVFTLDCSHLFLAKKTPLNHRIKIIAKQLGSRNQHIIGESKGLTNLTEGMKIKTNVISSLPPGHYRLMANVQFGSLKSDEVPKTKFFQGRAFQVI